MRTSQVIPLALVLLSQACLAQTKPGDPMPPRSWVDKDTGHRVWRLSDEANSGGFYFNINAYTADNKQMIYTAPDGIHVLDMTTHATKLLVPNPKGAADASSSAAPAPGILHTLVAGHKTNSVFYTSTDAAGVTSVYKADTNTGSISKLVALPKIPNTNSFSVVSVNADETLIAGTYLEGAPTGKEYGAAAIPAPAQPAGAARQSRSRLRRPGPTLSAAQQGSDDGHASRRTPAPGPLHCPPRTRPRRRQARRPQSAAAPPPTGSTAPTLLAFSDPELLMYCHEGSWAPGG